MGIRTTFVTEDINIQWPEWFIEKYKMHIHFKKNCKGSISTIGERRLTHDLPDLEKDIQIVIGQWNASVPREYMKIDCLRLVFLHEAVSFINRPVYVEIMQKDIKYYISNEWEVIDKEYLNAENIQIYGNKEVPEPLDLALMKRQRK